MIIPNHFAVVSSGTEGDHKLTAFDTALLKAGVGNLNLLRVSSILPPNMTRDDSLITLPSPGSLLPIAYGSIISDVPGTVISASVGIGLSSTDEYGVIMEYSGECAQDVSRATIQSMLEEAFHVRGRQLETVIIESAEHTVTNIGCAFAAVPMWRTI